MRDNLFAYDIDPDKLWTGESDNNRAINTSNKLGGVYGRRDFWLKPYNLSIERLMEIDIEMQQVVQEKSRDWVEHISKIKSNT
jgi:hypothetical protein